MGVWYTDTDSFWTEKKMRTGSGLGELKLEKEVDYAIFLLPKTYRAEKKYFCKTCKEFHTGLSKMKGIRHKKAVLVGMKVFLDLLEGEAHMQTCGISDCKFQKKKVVHHHTSVDPGMHRLKGALKRGKILALEETTAKVISARYDKRVLTRVRFGEWVSKPHFFNKGRVNHGKKINRKKDQVIRSRGRVRIRGKKRISEIQ